MSSLLKTVFGSPKSQGTGMPKSPSFDDFSMGSKEDHEDYLERRSGDVNDDPSAILPPAGSPMGKSRNHVWQGVFNPGRNYSENMRGGRDYFDSVDDKKFNPTIWDHVLKAQRHRTFESLDKDNDGLINAEDLRQALGRSEDVTQLIAAADRNGDGKIDRAEFNELLKNSVIAS